MPNIDAGAYFLTAIVPVCNEGIVEHEGLKSSPIHVVREVLETLPTALQSHATEEIGLQSPFARNLRTHFARIVVLDQPYFNGRDPSDTLVNAIRNTNLLQPQAVDELPCPYLLVMIEFDLPADNDGAGEPARYLEELWQVMAPELRSIFAYCYGFPAVQDGAAFARYIIGCQVETTMPFHDYWYEAPKLPSLSTGLLAAFPFAGLLLPVAAATFGEIGWGTAALLAVMLILLGILIDYILVMQRGARPFPANPEQSLRHVLKGLYLQLAFARFASDQQRLDRAQWGAAFRQFLTANRPHDLDDPTQPPGVIRSRLPGDAA